MIERQVVLRLLFELGQLAGVIALYPAGRRHIHGLELALDLVFIAQSVRYDIELQRPNRAENQVVVAQRFE